LVIQKRNPDILSKNDWIFVRKIRDVINVFEAKDHRIVQIGDNDSGRILKVAPMFYGNKEDCLDPKEINSLLDCILQTKNNHVYTKLIETFHISFEESAYCENKIIEKQDDSGTYDLIDRKCRELKYVKGYYINTSIGKIKSYMVLRDFGLIKIECEDADIFIRSVPNYEKMDISHAHDDVFSFQIINGKERIEEDLGSIVYTADKEKRYFYASAKGHNVPVHSDHIVKRIDMFVTETDAVGKISIRDNSILVVAEWNDLVHIRKFELFVDGLKITDFSNEKFELNYRSDKYYSLGYGQLYRSY
jgi:hypothetical protein